MSQFERTRHQIPTNSHRPQYLACGILCFGGILGGQGQGWSSTALPSLVKSGHFSLSPSELSWIASIAMLGAFLSSPTGGYLIRKLGRKNTLLLSFFPFTIGWIALAVPFQIWMFYVGRFLVGLGLGVLILAGSVYLSEISEPELRGTLGVIWFVAIRLGILFEYGVGSLLPYNQLSAISVVFSIAFGASIYFLPESPRWLMSKWRRQQAIDSLCWLRACDKSSPSPKILAEIDEIQEAVVRAEKENQGSFKLSTYFTNGIILKSLLLASLLMLSKEGCGGNMFSYYVVQVFEKTGSALESHLSGVIIGLAQLAGILVTTYYVDRVGRRILLITTFIIMSISLILIGLFYQFRTNLDEITQHSNWIPLIAFVIYHASFSGGPFVLTYTVTGEIIPTNVIGSISGFATSLAWISAFVLARYYEEMNNGIGIANTFWFFAVLSAAGATCIHFLVPETVGRSLENLHNDQHFTSNNESKIEENATA